MSDTIQFDDLISMGQIRKTIPVGNHQIAMHTLSSLEFSQMSERLGGIDKDPSGAKLEVLQREVVASAIDTIDGKSLTHKEKMDLLGSAQLGLANMLYTVYSQMVEEQEKTIDEAKKKFSPMSTSSTL